MPEEGTVNSAQVPSRRVSISITITSRHRVYATHTIISSSPIAVIPFYTCPKIIILISIFSIVFQRLNRRNTAVNEDWCTARFSTSLIIEFCWLYMLLMNRKSANVIPLLHQIILLQIGFSESHHNHADEEQS